MHIAARSSRHRKRSSWGVARGIALGSTLLLGPALLLGHSSLAWAEDDVQACVAAYEQTQALRKDGRLVDAKDQAFSCAQASCPEVVRGDCSTWYAELEAAVPTVSFAIVDRAGLDTTRARVFIDGELFADGVGAAAMPIDPGEYVMRVEIDGADPIEEPVVVREGDKNRILSFSFYEEQELPPPTSDSTPPEPSDGIPAATFVFGGIGILGLAGFGTFAALGSVEKSDLEDTCAPDCSEDQVDSVRTKFLVADISLGVGIVSLGVAGIVWLTAGGDSAAVGPGPRIGGMPIAVDVVPVPGGGVGVLRGEL